MCRGPVLVEIGGLSGAPFRGAAQSWGLGVGVGRPEVRGAYGKGGRAARMLAIVRAVHLTHVLRASQKHVLEMESGQDRPSPPRPALTHAPLFSLEEILGGRRKRNHSNSREGISVRDVLEGECRSPVG